MTLTAYLETTQDLFWEITEHGNVGLDSIYAAAGISRQEHGNRALFLFQPFEPAPATAESVEGGDMRFVVMKGSEVRMYQPYALVVEVSRTVSGHLVKIMFDEVVYEKCDAERIGDEIVGIVEKLVEIGTKAEETGVDAFLEGLSFG